MRSCLRESRRATAAQLALSGARPLPAELSGRTSWRSRYTCADRAYMLAQASCHPTLLNSTWRSRLGRYPCLSTNPRPALGPQTCK